MNIRTESGFTVIEVIIAVMVLSIGLLGLASTAATVTRMIAQGQRYSEVQASAMDRIEIIRAQGCPANGSGTATNGAFITGWTVANMATGTGKTVKVVVTSPTGTGTRADTFNTNITCVT